MEFALRVLWMFPFGGVAVAWEVLLTRALGASPCIFCFALLTACLLRGRTLRGAEPLEIAASMPPLLIASGLR